jgi:hypothetical protein
VPGVVLFAVRYLLPAAIAVGGLVAIALGNPGMGIVLIGIGGLVFGMNYYWRLSFAEQSDRQREEEAREYFDRHGRWPDEDD